MRMDNDATLLYSHNLNLKLDYVYDFVEKFSEVKRKSKVNKN